MSKAQFFQEKNERERGNNSVKRPDSADSLKSIKVAYAQQLQESGTKNDLHVTAQTI